MENEGVKRKLVEAENSLNSVGMELASKTREVAELQKSLQARNDALAVSALEHVGHRVCTRRGPASASTVPGTRHLTAHYTSKTPPFIPATAGH